MADQQQPGQVTYNYDKDQARAMYSLLEKPTTMSDHEWAIVSDEGFRKYMASQLGIPYTSRLEMQKHS